MSITISAMLHKRMELCRKVYELHPDWRYEERFYTNYNNDIGKYEEKENFFWVTTPHESSYDVLKSNGKWTNNIYKIPNTKDWFKGFQFPAYSVEYLLSKVRNYDFAIDNLNDKTLSLTSDSLNDPNAEILGEEFDILLMEFILVLNEEGIKL